MLRQLNILIIRNLLFHLNNFILFILVYNFNGLEGFAALWFFTPFILVFFTSLIAENPNVRSNKALKKLAISDLTMRGFIIFINFFCLSDVLPINMNYLVAINIVSLIVTLFMEWRMLQYAKNDSLNDTETVVNYLSKKERNHLINAHVNDQVSVKNKSSATYNHNNNSFHLLIYSGYSNTLIFILIFLGVFSFRIFGIEYRGLMFLLAGVLLLIYLILNEKKMEKYNTIDKKGTFIKHRDNITAILGLAIIYILQGIIHIGETTFNFLGLLLAVILFIPTFQTNKKIKEYFYTINRK